MDLLPKIPSVWVGDDNTEYTVQDYISQTYTLKAFSYIMYILLWGGGLHLLNLFNTKYDRASIISAFLIGILLIFAFSLKFLPSKLKYMLQSESFLLC